MAKKPNMLLTGSKGYIATNLKYLYKKSYNFIEVDKQIIKKAEDVLEFENVDYIVHLAAISGLAACNEDPDQTFIDNISSTMHLMKAAHAFDIPMVFLSSQAAKEPLSSLYATTKRIGEVEGERLNIQGAKIKMLRCSNIYGGKDYLRMKSSVVSKFLNAYKNNEPLVIHGDGSQVRDFIHVEEVIRCINLCLGFKDIDIPHPIDVGMGYGRKVGDVAKLISNNIEYQEDRGVGTSSNVSNPNEIYKLIGFHPQEKLEEYIKSQIK